MRFKKKLKFLKISEFLGILPEISSEFVRIFREAAEIFKKISNNKKINSE